MSNKIDRRDDVSPKEGEHEYGKVEFADPVVQRRFLELGQETPPPEKQTPAALKEHQSAEIAKWWPIVKAANIKAD